MEKPPWVPLIAALFGFLAIPVIERLLKGLARKPQHSPLLFWGCYPSFFM
jgi:hypothetical protein